MSNTTKSKNLNVPNILSLTRIVMTFVIIILFLLTNVYVIGCLNTQVVSSTNYYLSVGNLTCMILFVLAAFTDFLDGKIARKFNLVTTMGKFLDLIADKLLANTCLILFACCNILPIWIVIILIVRDFLIDVLRQIGASKNVIIASNIYGKVKFFAESIAITLLFVISPLNLSLGVNSWDWKVQLTFIPIYITLVLSLLSLVIYYKRNWKVLI